MELRKRESRAETLAYSLAFLQGQEHLLKYCLRTVKKYDSLMQRVENIRSSRRARKNRPKGSSGYKELRVSETKTPRNEISSIVEAVVHKIRYGLKRYTLRKRARSLFKLRCNRDEFISLIGGFAKIFEYSRTGKLKATIEGKGPSEVMSKLSEMLNFKKEERNWFCRRYYGINPGAVRDCAYIHIVPDHEQKKCVLFEWVEEHTHDVDAQGNEHVTSLGYLRCKFPRDTKPVKPKKSYLIKNKVF